MSSVIPEIPIVRDIFPTTPGIFSSMQSYALPMDGGQMDLLFYADFGLKTVSPLVTTLLGDDDELSSQKIALLGTMLLNKYRTKWDHDMAIINASYDPLHNYLDEYHEEGSATEDESNSHSSTGTWNETIDTDNTYSRTDNLSQVDSGSYSNSDTGSDSQNRFGLNSETSVPVTEGENSVTSSGTNGNTRTNTGTQTDAELRDEERDITDTKSESGTIDNDKTHEKDGYHRGNIGNISTQKLILEEIELWRWNIVDEMLHDARDFLTLPMYRD